MNNNQIEMHELSDEEEKLRREYKRLVEIYDAEARKHTRITKLKKMIAAIPKLSMPKVGEAEEKAIRELDEMEIRHNHRHERNKIINMLAEATNKKGNPCVSVDATLTLTYDPVNIDVKNETVMVIMLVKGKEASIRADIARDIDVREINQIQTTISRSYQKPEEEESRMKFAKETDVRPQETNVPDTEGVKSVTIRQPRSSVARTTEPRPSTSESRSTKGSRKRILSYKEASTTASESQNEDDQNRSEEETRKKRKTISRKKKPEEKETKIPKTVAKDGRKLVDLTNRIRDSRGRILGYKPGAESSKKKPKRKSVKTNTTECRSRVGEEYATATVRRARGSDRTRGHHRRSDFTKGGRSRCRSSRYSTIPAGGRREANNPRRRGRRRATRQPDSVGTPAPMKRQKIAHYLTILY